MWRLPRLVTTLVIIVVLVGGSYVAASRFFRQAPSAVNVPTAVSTSTSDASPKMPPPLEQVKFPSETIDYPTDWPDELHYPPEFDLVEANFRPVIQKGPKVTEALMKYTGDPKSATELLSLFFSERGWQVIERLALDSGGFVMLVEKRTAAGDLKGSGDIVIDPDLENSGQTKILATVYP